MNNKYILKTIFPAVVGLVCACSEKTDIDADTYGADVQEIIVRVESVGETLVKQKDPGENTITSITPYQAIDKLVMLIIDRSNGNVVYKKIFDGWSSTGNITSVPYIEGDKRGREAIVNLKGENRLKKNREYVAYAVGYHTGSYGNYVPYKDIETGSYFGYTEMARLPEGEKASEIFAGAQSFVNIGGKIVADPVNPDISDNPAIILRRQVAGTFGYFTGIPVTVDGKKVKSLRLVTSKRNKAIIFAGFRSQENPNEFNQENVINGTEQSTGYDCRMYGSEQDNAFTVYRIELNEWFPGEGELPLDMNGDGFLDGNDYNWTLPQYIREDMIKLEKGCVYDSRYLIATAMTKEDVEQKLPTFELQILGEDDEILKYWDANIRADEALRKVRTIVELAPEIKGGIRIVTEDSPESNLTYSIARNNIYTLGEKNSDQSYGEDMPIDLSREQVLIMDVNPEWKGLDAIIFN